MRIVLGALCVGVLTAAAVLIWLRQVAPPPQPEFPVLSFVALGFAAFMAVFSAALPVFLQAAWRRQLRRQAGPPATGPEDAWWARYQTRLILQAAPLEGAAFLQLIAYHQEGLPVSLAVAGGLLLCLLMLFPTRDGVERWVATQRDLAQQGR
jgi:hypothetical protein